MNSVRLASVIVIVAVVHQLAMSICHSKEVVVNTGVLANADQRLVSRALMSQQQVTNSISIYLVP